MKKFLLFFLVLFCFFVFTACDSVSSEYYTVSSESYSDLLNDSIQPFDMENVGSSNDGKFVFFRDPISDVLYIWRKSGYSGGLTVMLDPESGLPLTYSRYISIYDDFISQSK